MRSDPTLVLIPCFSGAPWRMAQLEALADRRMRTMRLPERLDDVDGYADYVLDQCRDLDDYVLVGDSFGGVIALAAAVRQPPRLSGLVVSSASAAHAIDSPLAKRALGAARLLPGPLFRAVTLRLHAVALASPYDGEGELPWTVDDTRELFIANTTRRSYVARLRAAFEADYTCALHHIRVPTLILEPDYDFISSQEAARGMLDEIPNAREVVLPRTGPMFRFSHPLRYAGAIEDFLRGEVTRPRAPGWIEPPMPPLTAH